MRAVGTPGGGGGAAASLRAARRVCLPPGRVPSNPTLPVSGQSAAQPSETLHERSATVGDFPQLISLKRKRG